MLRKPEISAGLMGLLGSYADFTFLHHSLIRDRIVLGVHAGDTRNGKRLLRQTKLILQKCIDIVKSDEASNTQMKIIQTSKTEDVHKLKDEKAQKNRARFTRQECEAFR